MNIIIPLGGKGERFSKNGYTQPKPLIPIFEKSMIEYVLDNLTISNDDHLFIIYNTKLDDHNFSMHINTKYPFAKLIQINDTKGAVETLFLGVEQIFNKHAHHSKCLILDCDTFYTDDIVECFKNSTDNMVFYTKNYDQNPIYSYIELNDESMILNIEEKNKISDNANTGAYAFTDIRVLHSYCQHVLNANITFNNEPYTSCVISEMVKSKIPFRGHELKTERVFSLGTPASLQKYIDDTHAFLFDLDGTLVITDQIYFVVWYEILINYNIVLNEEIFAKFIQGNNDKYVLNTLLQNIELLLDDLSKMKDELFIKNIDKIQLIDGVSDFIKKIKMAGHKISIVTNCNKNVATEIIKHIQLDNMVDFVISSNDCVHGKPNCEPYSNAIKKYNIQNSKCFIFEDSKTGILSGKQVSPKMLIGVETNYDKSEMINYGVDLSIKNYRDLNVNALINDENDTVNYLKKIIEKNSAIGNIKEILLNEHKLKGGFIADVISYKIVTSDKTYSQIMKYENTQENNLSNMAKQLKLYEREYYFYTNISHKVNINIPKYYNLIVDEKDNTIGVVLENLFDRGYANNLNLNTESIDVTLKIVDRMAKMHSTFWNKDLSKIFPKLKGSTDEIFCPFFTNFIDEKYEMFKTKWFRILNKHQANVCDEIYKNFGKIQASFSNGSNLTFIHGDIKSPNIFYDPENNNEPHFIDWQHCAIGKGVQDLIFFIIESFCITNIKSIFNLAKEYYYHKLLEYGVANYSMEEYESDIYNAICYIPFFTGVWFGTISQDELIDKNFPYFLISKMFHLIEIVKK